jgi:uncharacterized protein
MAAGIIGTTGTTGAIFRGLPARPSCSIRPIKSHHSHRMNQTDPVLGRSLPDDPIHPWISLLVLQPSPFCNINCDYCYLPNRTSKKRMPLEIVAATIEKVFAAELVFDPLTVIWHAGEPLAVPISYYEQAFDEIRRKAPAGAVVRHCMQSNGTLINDAWCRFIDDHNVSIGLSIDGPADIHDAHRRTRLGKGSHQAAMRGLHQLQLHGIPFHVITVITQQSLGRAKEIYDFFNELGVSQLGFNVEEIEGENAKSSLTSTGWLSESVEAFMGTIFELQKAGGGRMRIREFDAALGKIQSRKSLRSFDFPYFNEQVRPFGILNVDCDGNYSTYSPELLGMNVSPYGSFSFGNILMDDFVEAVESPKFRSVFTDIQSGINLCRDSCAYYGYCGGGAPANKYYENGSFATAETMFCKYSVKLPLEIVLNDLETSLVPAVPEGVLVHGPGKSDQQ